MYRPPPTGSQQTGLVARFERPENRMVSKPVVAFDDGAAMVLSSENRLVAAYRQPGYAGLKPVPTAVGALTAEPGVRVRRRSTGDDECPAWTTLDCSRRRLAGLLRRRRSATACGRFR